jgi:serine/threonine protein kinase
MHACMHVRVFECAYFRAIVCLRNVCRLVMDRCECSLDVLLSGKHDDELSLPEQRQIALDILEGLAYVHNQSVFHSDIKPKVRK